MLTEEKLGNMYRVLSVIKPNENAKEHTIISSFVDDVKNYVESGKQALVFVLQYEDAEDKDGKLTSSDVYLCDDTSKMLSYLVDIDNDKLLELLVKLSKFKVKLFLCKMKLFTP